jgi:glycosyltransferase involved in cell wall biosynthesis
MNNKLSVVIPVYNEKNTIEKLIDLVIKSRLSIEKEIIAVNDASSDGSKELLEKIKPKIGKLIHHEKNKGKGEALRTGFGKVTGDIVIIQDADLEYDPNEYQSLIGPILEGKADVVYGSRFTGAGPHRVMYFWHSVANKMLTLLSNMFSNLNLTDMETCYKVFRTEILKKINLKENGFGIEPELTAKLAKIKGIRIYEVGISYSGRTYSEGKKIGMKDAFRAFYCILRYNLFN